MRMTRRQANEYLEETSASSSGKKPSTATAPYSTGYPGQAKSPSITSNPKSPQDALPKAAAPMNTTNSKR